MALRFQKPVRRRATMNNEEIVHCPIKLARDNHGALYQYSYDTKEKEAAT